MEDRNENLGGRAQQQQQQQQVFGQHQVGAYSSMVAYHQSAFACPPVSVGGAMLTGELQLEAPASGPRRKKTR